MNSKLRSNIFWNINNINDRIEELENKLMELENSLDKALTIQRSHLLRVKNGDVLADDFIVNGRPYNDLSPDRAFEIYNGNDNDFVLLDVSEPHYQPPEELPEAIKIPLEELHMRHAEIVNKATQILVISENGTRSILASEILNRCGHYNVNNISGGYKFWPGFRKQGQTQDQKRQSA